MSTTFVLIVITTLFVSNLLAQNELNSVILIKDNFGSSEPGLKGVSDTNVLSTNIVVQPD